MAWGNRPHRGPSSGARTREHIVETIATLHGELEHWPSPADVIERLDIPPRTLRYHLDLLEREGRIRRRYQLEVVPPEEPAPQDAP